MAKFNQNEKFQSTTSAKHFLIKGVFQEEKNSFVVKQQNYISEIPDKQIAFIYLGSKSKFEFKQLNEALETILKSNDRNYQIDVNSFLNETIDSNQVIKSFILLDTKLNGKNFNLKTEKQNVNSQHILLTKQKASSYQEQILIANQINEIRYLQDAAPNILTIKKMVDYAQNLAKNNKSIKLKVLDKKDLLELGMNLIVGVNLGSYQNTKVLVLEYKPQASSKQNITFVGKGIIFDSGGYNLKTPGRYMLDMKYDMSGAAISLLLIDTISKLKIKQNISCVIPLTDNLVNEKAQLPESIWKSMSGKTVEVANTDAEGRLILADAITYAAKKLKSSLIIDIATLTGTVEYALGSYTGVWTSTNKYWPKLEQAAKTQNEKIWQMPMDQIYLESLVKNTFADTLSCSNTDRPDSNIAATWLNQFALGVDYIHLDIAATAEKNSKAQAPMFQTLVEFVKKI